VRASSTAFVLGLTSNNYGTCMLREAHGVLDEKPSISEFYKQAEHSKMSER